MTSPRLPYTQLAPEFFAPMRAAEHYLNSATALPRVLLELVRLRVSQCNGCHFCTGQHTRELERHNEPATRIAAVADWQASDAFTQHERAALRWADVVTDVQTTHANDAEYAAVSEFFTGKDLVDLTACIASINAWNRIGIAFDMRWAPRPKPAPEAARDAIADDGGKVAEE